MERSIYRYIWRFSKRQQIVVLIFTLTTFPLLYFSLEVPKIIINEALGGEDFPQEFLGIELDQIAFLLTLCALYLGLVIAAMRELGQPETAERLGRVFTGQPTADVVQSPQPLTVDGSRLATDSSADLLCECFFFHHFGNLKP